MAIRGIASLVGELEAEAVRERTRAEEAEGKLRLYEQRAVVHRIAVTAKTDTDFKIRYEMDGESTEIPFSPGHLLLLLTEKYLEKPQALSLTVEPISTSDDPEQPA